MSLSEILGGVGRGLQAFYDPTQYQAGMERRRQSAQRDALKDMLYGVQQGGLDSPEAQELMVTNPQAYDRMVMRQARLDQVEEGNRKDFFTDMATTSDLIQSGLGDEAKRNLVNRINKVESRGGDASESIRMLQMLDENPEMAIQGLMGLQIMGQRQGYLAAPKADSISALDQEKLDIEREKLAIEREKLGRKSESDKKRSQEAKREVNRMANTAKSFEKMLTNPNFSDAVGVGDQFTSAIGAQFGTEAGKLYKQAERAASRLVLDAAGALKGAMSDRDIDLLKESAPSVSDSEAVWLDWYNNEYIPVVKSAAEEAGTSLSELGLSESLSSPKARKDPRMNRSKRDSYTSSGGITFEVK